MLKIWGRRNSLNVQKVLWLVGELKLPNEHHQAGGKFGGLADPAFLKLNPHGKIPVIDDGGIVVWESHSIVRYLCAHYSEGRFWANDPGERSLADRWMDWTLATLQKDFYSVFESSYRMPEDRRDRQVIDRAVGVLSADFSLLDRHLSGQAYLAGADLTMADFTAGTLLYRYFDLGIERPPLPNVQAWYGRLSQRKAYSDNVMVPFDDLKGNL